MVFIILGIYRNMGNEASIAARQAERNVEARRQNPDVSVWQQGQRQPPAKHKIITGKKADTLLSFDEMNPGLQSTIKALIERDGNTSKNFVLLEFRNDLSKYKALLDQLKLFNTLILNPDEDEVKAQKRNAQDFNNSRSVNRVGIWTGAGEKQFPALALQSVVGRYPGLFREFFRENGTAYDSLLSVASASKGYNFWKYNGSRNIRMNDRGEFDTIVLLCIISPNNDRVYDLDRSRTPLDTRGKGDGSLYNGLLKAASVKAAGNNVIKPSRFRMLAYKTKAKYNDLADGPAPSSRPTPSSRPAPGAAAPADDADARHRIRAAALSAHLLANSSASAAAPASSPPAAAAAAAASRSAASATASASASRVAAAAPAAAAPRAPLQPRAAAAAPADDAAAAHRRAAAEEAFLVAAAAVVIAVNPSAGAADSSHQAAVAAIKKFRNSGGKLKTNLETGGTPQEYTTSVLNILIELTGGLGPFNERKTEIQNMIPSQEVSPYMTTIANRAMPMLLPLLKPILPQHELQLLIVLRNLTSADEINIDAGVLGTAIYILIVKVISDRIQSVVKLEVVLGILYNMIHIENSSVTFHTMRSNNQYIMALQKIKTNPEYNENIKNYTEGLLKIIGLATKGGSRRIKKRKIESTRRRHKKHGR
jgi:hypothetical protein